MVFFPLSGCYLTCNTTFEYLSRRSCAEMALQERLDRFKKQQEKCQSTLTSIAAKAGPSKSASFQKTTPVAASPLTNPRTPGPPVKFSNDTERLQHINSIRKGPVGAQIKRVIDLLLEVHS